MRVEEKNKVIKRALDVFKIKGTPTLKERERMLLFSNIKNLKDAPEYKINLIAKLLGEPGTPISPDKKTKAFAAILSPNITIDNPEQVESSKLNKNTLKNIQKIVENNYELAEYGEQFGISLAISSEERDMLKRLQNPADLRDVNPHLLNKLAALIRLEEKIVNVLQAVDKVKPWDQEHDDQIEVAGVEVSDALDLKEFTVIRGPGREDEKEEEASLGFPDLPGQTEDLPELEEIGEDQSVNSETSTTAVEEEIPTSWSGRIKHLFGIKEDRDIARAVLERQNPGKPDFVNSELRRYIEREEIINALVHEDIHGARAFNIELEIPDLIYQNQLKEFFSRVLQQYSNFSGQSLIDAYANNPKGWVDSDSIRARLVIIEADNNIDKIAKAVLEASPLERIVIAGLDEAKQEVLKGELIRQWEARITTLDPEGSIGYEAKLREALELGNEPNITDAMAHASVKTLMGPHAFVDTKDISFENMQRGLDTTFSTKIDEILLYGKDEGLANELPVLTKKSGADQYLAVRAEDFLEGENVSEYWTASLTGEDALERLTSAKGPNEILSEGGHTVNPTLNTFFEEKGKDHGLKEEDVSYLKDMFLSNSLYPNNLSPKLYASTITKAQSGINGKGAVAVGEALPWGVVGRIIATAQGARFAVNATMFDTANDINQEEQEKMLTYKGMFNDLLLHYSKDKSLNKQEVYEKAAEDVFTAYKTIESDKNIIEHNNDAETLRLSSFIHANRTNVKNERGINLIKPQPLSFAYGVVATGVGIALAVTGTAVSIAFPILGAAVFVGFAATLTASLLYQRSANAVHLSRWHRLSARARTSKKNAQDVRQKEADKFKHSIENGKAQTQSQTQDLNLGREQDLSNASGINTSETKKTEKKRSIFQRRGSAKKAAPGRKRSQSF
ncbi:hypothetical protein [Ascidiimonas sp. W6]|uniref:hypothetical protein n=1 Tax=Ascidiimonas meishanensis TaxID=3128903 RepID=UPI0030EB38D9